MFTNSQNLSIFVAKIWLAMTFFVALAACSHEQVRMESMSDVPKAAVSTPDSPAVAPSAVDKVAHSPRRHRHHQHKVAKASVRKHRAKRIQAVARVSKPSGTPSVKPQVVQVPPPPQAPIAALATVPEVGGTAWGIWLAAIVAAGLLFLGVRAGTRRNVTRSGRRRRRLLFNS